MPIYVMTIWNTMSMRRYWWKVWLTGEVFTVQRWCRFKKGRYFLLSPVFSAIPLGYKVTAQIRLLCVSWLHLLPWLSCFTSLEFHSYQLAHMSARWLCPDSQRSHAGAKQQTDWRSIYLEQNLIRSTGREETLLTRKQSKLCTVSDWHITLLSLIDSLYLYTAL